MKNEKKHSFTVRLLKTKYSPEEALKNLNTLHSYNIKPSFNLTGKIYSSKQIERTPMWLDTAKQFSDQPMNHIKNKNSGVVLFVKVDSRFFAFTFGQGMHMLRSNSQELDFGLKVTLNSVDPEQIRSIEAKTIDERLLKVRQNSSKHVAVETFGLNTSRDLVGAVTGIPRDSSFANRVAGAEALTFNATMKLENLGKKCTELLSMYNSEKYKERFGWIDNIVPEKDKKIISELDNILLKALHDKKVENLYLAPPDVVNWQDINGFYFQPKGNIKDLQPDLMIEDFWQKFSNNDSITIDRLRNNIKAVMVYGKDDYFKKLSLYKCIVFETEYLNSLYVLTEGSWFKVDTDFVKTVDDALLNIPQSKIKFPTAKRGESEGTYNKRASVEMDNTVYMDQDAVMIGGGKSKFEFCDLYTLEKQMIHIKRRSKEGSKPLSHLFAQGKMSAIAFFEDKEYRKKAKDKINDKDILIGDTIPSDNAPKKEDYTTVYAIISSVKEKNWQLTLPFFSRLNLVETYKEFNRYGMRAVIQKINISDSDPTN